MNTSNYCQVIEMTDAEKLEMYMKNCTKKELAKMLVNANKQLNCFYDGKIFIPDTGTRTVSPDNSGYEFALYTNIIPFDTVHEITHT